MVINPHKMKKAELLTFTTGRCKHRHTYIEHPSCYIKEQDRPQRIGFLDIEANGLKANFNIMLSYSIKVAGKNKIYSNIITKKELNSKTFDKSLVQKCIDDMLRFDKIVTYFGTYYDLPFIRTRALKWNIDAFPIYGMLSHTDVYFLVKSKLNLHRRSLEVVTRHLGIKGKNHVDGDLWIQAAIHGDKKALGYVLDHNKKDVIILEKVYNKIKQYSRETKKSI